MPPTPRFSHLFLPDPTKPHDHYSSPRRGSSPRVKPQDRATQAQRVKESLEAAWQIAVDRKAVAHSEKNGVYLEMSSEPGFELVLRSLETKNGIRLLNVHRSGPKDSEITRATIFIPQEQSGYFLQKVAAYATENNPPKGDGTTTPKNEKLINCIADVRAALLESAFWQDVPEKLPAEGQDWIEAWLSTEDLGSIEAFAALCQNENIEVGEGRLTFPERSVLPIFANREQLERIIELSDFIAEFRAVRAVASHFIEMENRDQVATVHGLQARTEIRDTENNVVLILDHGVNNGHPLISPLLANQDCHTVKAEWGVSDDHGHGTLMAGTVGYGDLLEVIQREEPIIVRHGLESAKILPPDGGQNDKRLWGYLTSQGISLAEIQAPNRTRTICMAVTSEDDPTRGRPSSWSAQIDDLAAGTTDEKRRLIIISGGNVNDPQDWKAFPDSNKTIQVHDPAQSWNALTVGAFTRKVQIVDPTLTAFHAMANEGSLSPYSSTSLTWPERKWPIKPEVLFEGGNVAVGPNDSMFGTEDLKLLSTYHDPQVAQFAPFWATSVASAQCAWMAAQIQASYPSAWPETVRALIVHSAEWTAEQKRQFLNDQSKTSYARLARICGYGVANLERALSCASNSLSLVAQATLQPFDKHPAQSRYVSKDMNLHRLPWPAQVLSDLGETMIRMRVTLSYFIEASPGEVGWKDRYRYASHGLRFELNGPEESEAEFIQRVNRLAREEDEHPGTQGANAHWTLGETRNVGSIHSDIWTGTTAQLALSNLIAIHPAVGWWRERHHLGKWNKQTRYSLIVSFELPGQDIDIYTPIATQLGVATPISIGIPA